MASCVVAFMLINSLTEYINHHKTISNTISKFYLAFLVRPMYYPTAKKTAGLFVTLQLYDNILRPPGI